MSLAVAAGYASFDRQRKLCQEIDYCAAHQQWDELLAKAEKLPLAAYSPYVNYQVNLALYHTGRLPYQMFSYPQPFCSPDLLVSPKVMLGGVPYQPFGSFLELGRISDAERGAIEMLEIRPTGAALKGLALAKLIKNQPVDARVVLNVLRDDLVWGQWAEQYLQRLAADPDLARDEDIQQSRALMLLEDDLYRTSSFGPRSTFNIDFGGMLLDLLKRNRENRMAFEYLMAIRLFDRDVQAAVQLFPFLDGLSYPAIPPLYEEAVMIYLCRHPEEATMAGSDVFFHDRKISDATKKKFDRLLEIAKANGGLNEKAETAVGRELGDTYFYYFSYGSRKRP